MIYRILFDIKGMRPCSNLNYVTGFRANTLSYQGPFTDDVAVENVQVECGYGSEIVDALPFDVPYQSYDVSQDLSLTNPCNSNVYCLVSLRNLE